MKPATNVTEFAQAGGGDSLYSLKNVSDSDELNSSEELASLGPAFGAKLSAIKHGRQRESDLLFATFDEGSLASMPAFQRRCKVYNRLCYFTLGKSGKAHQ